MFCSRCGSEIEEGSKFCSKCGFNLTNGGTVVQQKSAPLQREAHNFDNNVQNEKKFPKWIVLALILVIVLLGYCIVSGSDTSVDRDSSSYALNENAQEKSQKTETNTGKKQIEYIRYDLNKMCDDLSNNGVRAEQLYKGKRVEVQGIISSIRLKNF